MITTRAIRRATTNDGAARFTPMGQSLLEGQRTWQIADILTSIRRSGRKSEWYEQCC